MKVDTSKYTYQALLAYACSRGDQEFSVTQAQLLSWFDTQVGLPLSRATLSKHLQALQAAGKVQVSYTNKGRAVYCFPDGVVTRQRLEFVPTSTPGQFVIEDDGADILSAEGHETPEQVHARVMASLDDLDLDTLQAFWGERSDAPYPLSREESSALSLVSRAMVAA